MLNSIVYDWKVRIVNIVEDTSTARRRKRQADEVTFFVEIADDPGEPNTIDYDTVVSEVVDAVSNAKHSKLFNSECISWNWLFLFFVLRHIGLFILK